MGIALEALRTFPYAGATIRAGHLFHAKTTSDALALTTTKLARYPVKSKRIEPDPEPEAPEDEPRPKRHYRRRDLTAE